MREIKADSNKWKDILYSWIGRCHTIYVKSLPIDLSSQCNPIQNLRRFFCMLCMWILRFFLKYIQNRKGPRIAKCEDELEQKWKTYKTRTEIAYKTTVIKTLYYWCKDRQIDSHHGHLVYKRGIYEYKRERKGFSKEYWVNWIPKWKSKIKESDPQPTPRTKVDSRYIVDLTVKRETTVFWKFPGGPAVRTPCFHCGGLRFNPWLGK